MTVFDCTVHAPLAVVLNRDRLPSSSGCALCLHSILFFAAHTFFASIMDANSHEKKSAEKLLLAAVRDRDWRAVLRALLGAPTVNINVVDDEKYTPLHHAASKGDLEILQILLNSRHGVNLEARDQFGRTPLQCAVEYGRVRVAQELMDQGADIEAADDEQTASLMRACKRQDQAMALMLIERGACFNTMDKYEQTALHHACEGGDDWTLVKLLLEKGANVNATTHDCLTPLYLAAFYGRLESMRVLLANGSNLEATSIDGFTALGPAVLHDHLRVVRLLLKSGATMHANTLTGGVPLHYARSQAVTDLLLRRGDNIYARKKNGTPLDKAIFSNQPGQIQSILQHYGKKSVRAHGRQSLQAILRDAEYVEVRKTGSSNNETVIKKMISLPVGKLTIPLMLESLLPFVLVYLQDPEMNRIWQQEILFPSPLYTVCQDAGDAPVALVRWLAEKDWSALQSSDRAGRLPLHVACRARAPAETVQFLVEHGGGTEALCARDHSGGLPLHSMVTRVFRVLRPTHAKAPSPPPKVDAVQYWIKQDPKSVATRNNHGELPIMLACQSSAPEEVLFVLLREYPSAIDYMKDYYNR